MLKNKVSRRAFTLVELLVTLAVSSIIIGATFASYNMVSNQYKKSMDIADMQTSGRSIVQIIERDVRMAGFVYLDSSAINTYGAITKPLVITDSFNSCCDGVVIIYDSINEETNKVERIRITYSTVTHTGTKGTRNRLYKQIDILGQDNVLLTPPTLGTKDVMADFVEDFQIINVAIKGSLYLSNSATNAISLIDFPSKVVASTINPGPIKDSMHAMAYGDGFLYLSNSGTNAISVIDIASSAVVSTISPGDIQDSMHAMAYGGDSLYLSHSGTNAISVIDVATKAVVSTINPGHIKDSMHAMAYGGGFLYLSHSGTNVISVIDVASSAVVSTITLGNIKDNMHAMALKSNKSGSESLLTIHLTLRTKNAYGNVDKNFTKKDYHKGNFELDITDKYKRDTYTSTVFARNMVL